MHLSGSSDDCSEDTNEIQKDLKTRGKPEETGERDGFDVSTAVEGGASDSSDVYLGIVFLIQSFNFGRHAALRL